PAAGGQQAGRAEQASEKAGSHGPIQPGPGATPQAGRNRGSSPFARPRRGVFRNLRVEAAATLPSGVPMSLIDPLARRLEHFVYDRVCALCELAPPDNGGSTGPDSLASPLDGSQ